MRRRVVEVVYGAWGRDRPSRCPPRVVKAGGAGAALAVWAIGYRARSRAPCPSFLPSRRIVPPCCISRSRQNASPIPEWPLAALVVNPGAKGRCSHGAAAAPVTFAGAGGPMPLSRISMVTCEPASDAREHFDLPGIAAGALGQRLDRVLHPVDDERVDRTRGEQCRRRIHTGAHTNLMLSRERLEDRHGMPHRVAQCQRGDRLTREASSLAALQRPFTACRLHHRGHLVEGRFDALEPPRAVIDLRVRARRIIARA